MARIVTGFLVLFACYHTAQHMMLYQNNPALFLGLMIAFLPLAWGVARWEGFSGLSAWGLTGGKTAFTQTGKGFLAGILVFGVFFFTNLGLDIERIDSIPEPGIFFSQLCLFLAGTFFPSLAEDILTRSYLYRFLQNKFPPYTLLVLSAVVYVLNHFERLEDGWLVWIYLFIIGLYLMLALQRTGNIWLTLGLHWSGNVLFQVTHTIIKTAPGKNNFPPMVIYICFLLLLLPVTYLLSRKSPAAHLEN